MYVGCCILHSIDEVAGAIFTSMRRKLVFIIVVFVIDVCCFNWTMQALRWADFLDPEDPDMDIYFDRVVGFVHDKYDNESYLQDHQVITSGVLISNSQVLTSFNAFSHLLAMQNERRKTLVVVLRKRRIERWKKVTYNLNYYQINCARQVMPLSVSELWHGPQKMHTPIHDLVVVRLNESLEILSPNQTLKSFDYYKNNNDMKNAGPLITEIASLEDVLGRDVKFASFGFRDDLHIWRNCLLHTMNFYSDDNVIENCDEWIPREWGHFICIRNTERFEGVGSAAMLVHNDKVFGVGSFALFKGTVGVLVFTDVRKYRHLILNTCTREDQNWDKSSEDLPPQN